MTWLAKKNLVMWSWFSWLGGRNRVSNGNASRGWLLPLSFHLLVVHDRVFPKHCYFLPGDRDGHGNRSFRMDAAEYSRRTFADQRPGRTTRTRFLAAGAIGPGDRRI